MQVKFYPKESASKLPTSLFARITYNYNSLKLYTDLKMNIGMWDHKNQRAKKDMTGAPEFNHRVTKYRERIQQCFTRYLNDNDNQEPPREELKRLLFIEFKKTAPLEILQAEKLKTFWGYLQAFIDQSENGVRKSKQGENISKSAIGNYKSFQKALKEYEAYKKNKITFETIDHEFYLDLIQFFEKVKKYMRNTIEGHFRILKTVMNESMEMGYHSNKRAKKFRTSTEDATSVYLNEKELNELYNLDLAHDIKLDKVRDLFIINCYTGGRFGDLQHINIKNIKADRLNPDHQYLTYKQNKTGNTVSIPVPTQLSEILKKYGNQLPRPLSNQNFNISIKEVCKKIPTLHEKMEIEFTKGGLKVIETLPKYALISTHTARRSFASNAYLSGQDPMNIRALTGHRTESAFLKYIRVTPMEKARLFKMHSDKVKNELKAI